MPDNEYVLGDGSRVELADLLDRMAARLRDPVTICFFVLGAFATYVGDFALTDFCVMVPCPDGTLDELGVRGDVESVHVIASLVVYCLLVIAENATLDPSGQKRRKIKRQMRVAARRDGNAPSPGRAFVRSLVPNAAGVGGCVAAALVDFRIPALAGLASWLLVYASAIVGKHGRGLHDLFAGTVVIAGPQVDT